LGGVCAVWKPYAPDWSHMGARLHHLEGGWHHKGVAYAVWSLMHQTRATGTVWESDGTIWKPHVTYEDHMRAVCAVWGLGAPYRRQMVPYGSHMHSVGTMLEPCAPCWHHVHHAGAMCAMWEPCGSQMVPFGRQLSPDGSCVAPKWGPYGSGMRCMGATCDGAIWEACGSCKHQMGAA
jgi:hypothetical protein